MKINDIIDLFGQLGIRWTKEEMNLMFDYCQRMISDSRVILVNEGDEPHTVIFYTICEDYEKYLKKPNWLYLEHNPKGHIFYVEVACSKGWSKGLRNDIRELIINKYPSVTMGKWFRYGKYGDRPVTVRRRIYV